MYKIWEQKGESKSLTQTIYDLSGMTEEELINPRTVRPETIENMMVAVDRIQLAIKNKQQITVFGDYDADGACAGAILYLTLKYLGIVPIIRMPKRITEGYGISEKAVDEIASGMLITVDNGIAAHEAIQKAREKGLEVIILDHHIPGNSLPNATVVVDPHINREKNGYADFCGAGLAFKLAEALIPEGDPLLEKLVAIAAIATIADVVPLTGANRVIVQDGLKALNRRDVTQGLKSLLEACDLTTIKEDDIGFKIAPVINAAGRIMDDGARFSCGCIAQDEKPIPSLATKLIGVNTQRKQMVADAYTDVVAQLTKGGQIIPPIVVLCPDLHEGIMGIVAGKLAEEFRMPAFVFTGSSDELKGSGRSFGSIHLKDLTDAAADLIEQYGGHAGAVGLKIKKSSLPQIKIRLKSMMADTVIDASDALYYDIAIDGKDVPAAIDKLKVYAPYGEHNPRPIFLIQNINLLQRYGEYAKYLGINGEHLKLTALGYSLIGFGASEQYKKLNMPKTIDVIGRLGTNDSVYGSSPQIEIVDFRPSV